MLMIKICGYIMQRRTVFIYAKEDPNTTISPKESNFITDTVTAVTVQMCRNRDLNLGTSISNLLCSARLLGLNFLCCGRGTTRAFIVCDRLTSSEEEQLFRAHETQA